MIKAQDIRKSYHGEEVLRGISLDISEGEFVSLMGKSGSGKSTLLGVLGGFLVPDSGHVLYRGEDITAVGADRLATLRRTEIGFVFQDFRLIPTLSVLDNIRLPSVLSGRRDAEGRIALLAERLGITAMLRKYPGELSGGQCQRAAIVRALSFSPRLLILDEPTGALDTVNGEAVMALLCEANRREGLTVLQVTHSEQVAAFGTRTVRIRDGVLE